jgi:hypothetical protein
MSRHKWWQRGPIGVAVDLVKALRWIVVYISVWTFVMIIVGLAFFLFVRAGQWLFNGLAGGLDV